VARRGDGIYVRITWMLLDAFLVAIGAAVTAFWWVVP
jgi:hypothetical protein